MSTVALLQRLRAQAGASALPIRCPPPVAAETVVPSAEAELLVARLRAAIARRSYHQAMSRLPDPVTDVVPDLDLGTPIAPGVRLLEVDYEDLQPVNVDLPWLKLEGMARADLAAFDIETTGLNAGVGVRAFLVGVADWCGDRLRVRQLLLESPAGESTQLATLAEWLSSKRVLMSYNGKSFDVPMMNSRYPLFGQPAPFAELAHLDFLPVVRRQLREQLTNCKLGTVEREWLGIVRHHDLPSSEVPSAWHEWLRSGREGKLKRAIAHHRQDLITLWRLLDRLGALPGSDAGK